MKRLTPLPFLLLLACGPASPEAPTELSELTRFLYAQHENEDPEVLAEGLGNLAQLLAEIDLEADPEERSWIPQPLEASDLVGLQRPEDRDLLDLLSISLAGPSMFPVADHALQQVQVDQLPAEPTATHYVRTVTAPEDPNCFVAGDCERLRTNNDVRRENFLMSVDFVFDKDFRWSFVGTDDGSGSERNRAIVGRSWFEESFPGDSGNTMLWQSYSLDLWLDDGSGGAQRFQTLWSESRVIDISDEVVRNVLRNSIDDIFVEGDVAIEALLAAE